MKNERLLVFAVVMLAVLTSTTSCTNEMGQEQSQSNQPEKVQPAADSQPDKPKAGPYGFETTEHQFGTVEKGTVVEKTYKFTNNSAQPYQITNVITSCPCMSASYSEESVAPGESGEVNVAFDTKDQFPATYEKIISVVFKGNQQPVPLFLKGKIIEK